jgi:hypothetical protein
MMPQQPLPDGEIRIPAPPLPSECYRRGNAVIGCEQRRLIVGSTRPQVYSFAPSGSRTGSSPSCAPPSAPYPGTRLPPPGVLAAPGHVLPGRPIRHVEAQGPEVGSP